MAPADMLLFSTAAPCNTPSWASLLAEGFPIHRIVTRYGGYARYLMVRDGAQYDVEDTRIVDPLDTPTQMTLFTQGWRGVTRTRLPSGSPGIVFARPMTNGL
ncbi:MAG: hypothetical protein B7Z15_11255 [Rhizobiales bacterium 32-66-8]|nr:MAG: hypothetical protein B7Z15_11255 [Rhizobiales bacterium 32-66-8]